MWWSLITPTNNRRLACCIRSGARMHVQQITTASVTDYSITTACHTRTPLPAGPHNGCINYTPCTYGTGQQTMNAAAIRPSVCLSVCPLLPYSSATMRYHRTLTVRSILRSDWSRPRRTGSLHSALTAIRFRRNEVR